MAINLTTKEYFMYTSKEDKYNKIKRLTEYTLGIKILSLILKMLDIQIALREARWNTNKDRILFNVDVYEFNEKYFNFNKIM